MLKRPRERAWQALGGTLNRINSAANAAETERQLMRAFKLMAIVPAAGMLMLAACEERQTTQTPTNTNPGTTDRAGVGENADNTGRNRRDADTNAKTPMDQQENTRDITITADVRRAILDDDTMSTNAENCKIITADGVVTLRGPVDSQAEKDAIEAKARAVAGVARVDNQLEIKVP